MTFTCAKCGEMLGGIGRCGVCQTCFRIVADTSKFPPKEMLAVYWHGRYLAEVKAHVETKQQRLKAKRRVVSLTHKLRGLVVRANHILEWSKRA